MKQLSTLALMKKALDGDDALLWLAKLRFEQCGLGAEPYADNPRHLAWLRRFMPEVAQPVIAHLQRGLDLASEAGRALVVEHARAGAGWVQGLVVHDQWEAVHAPEAYARALRELNAALEGIAAGPQLLVEYAVGIEPEAFAEVFERSESLAHIAPCVDVGHVGIAAARSAYARIHSSVDVCSLRADDPDMPRLIADVQWAVGQGRSAVRSLLARVGEQDKPLHLHVHDAHPLSTVSPWGVSDHLTFLEDIALPFSFEGKKSVPTMFGPEGLRQIVDTARAAKGGVSITLEIHETGEERPLRDAEFLFEHWSDKTNARRMDGWLATLQRNHKLLRSVL